MKKRLQAWGDTKVINIVGAFIFNEHGELLLLQRHSEDLGGGQWGTPGGRIEPGEDADTAMERELYEETKLKNTELVKLGAHLIHMPHGTVHMTSYRGLILKNASIVIDPEEHNAYAWFKLDGLLDEANILWGVPSILKDFGLIATFDKDPTLADGSSVELLELAEVVN
jgi:8-oxo-dGTP pyrophosphatase MutT (NUDIX family)